MNLIEALVILSAVYLAPHLDAQFARLISAGCLILAVAALLYKVLL